MKKQKPKQNKPITFKRPLDWKTKLHMGDSRPTTPEYPQDGKVFHCYKRIGDGCYEYWVTPKRLKEIRQSIKFKSPTCNYKKHISNQPKSEMVMKDGKMQLITGKQILNEAKDLVAKAMSLGLISKKA